MACGNESHPTPISTSCSFSVAIIIISSSPLLQIKLLNQFKPLLNYLQPLKFQFDRHPKTEDPWMLGSMYLLLVLVVVVLCLILIGRHGDDLSDRARQRVEVVGVFVNATAPIAHIDDDFVCATVDWWPPDKCDYGTCSWATASILNLDLNNTVLINAVKAFSPLKLRLGGSLEDKVVYQALTNLTSNQRPPCLPFAKNNSQMFGFTQGCLPLSRWDQLNSFFNQTGAKVVFSLNALAGRALTRNGLAVGAWDPSNAVSLIKYTVDKGYYNVHGWELGNELCGGGVGARVTADQYAADVNTLSKSVDEIYAGAQTKPLVIAPGGFFDPAWFTEFLGKATNSTVQAITHHIYNLGAGVDPHVIDRILDPSHLDSASSTFSSLRNILKNSRTPMVAWVGEAGGAYNSGRNLVTNAFAMSFWYLDQLGMASTYDTRTYCRQTLVGGNYGLLDTSTFAPNPDFYSALLWHRLMGRQVLKTTVTGTKKLRAYAHCAKPSQGMVVLLLNLDGETEAEVSISTEKGLFTTQLKAGETSKVTTREEYHLTAPNDDLQSRKVVLNGRGLDVDSTGDIPVLEPAIVNMSDPISVSPYSVVFVHIPNLAFPACSEDQSK